MDQRSPARAWAATCFARSAKIANITDITAAAPAPWSAQRKREYLDWAEQVVNQLRGTNASLEKLFDKTLAEKRALLAS